ncbi:MAG TPA: hypothetical protein VFX12_08200 [Vicinamibacterales bacterium]|nr:hypothetical protein [Vicinamibacterales bacterium]
MPRATFNPFPGLRPFEPDEDHLFFGREREIDELLRRLRSTRFLSVIGASGSGKSSLVRCGLIPSLYSGFMVAAGSSWRVAILRPGEDPIGNLAAALDAPDVLGAVGELQSTNRVLLEATLRRGTLGLVGAVRQSGIPAGENLLVIVDQFEELFRFRRSREAANSRDEAIVFVNLLLAAAGQTEVPIYVVLTMRSDFVGDCMQVQGLAEAVNDGQYLVPRMRREELRAAVTGPVAVGGAAIAPRLVLRILNDIGDNPDQLPVLQHALMRTWEYWERHAASGEPIDIADYDAVGTLQDALSKHAEEAYADSARLGGQLVERLFKALTDTFSDPRGVRRPTSVADLASICEASEAEVTEAIEIFRRPGRSFLMPPARIPLTSRSIVDLSHESLMRCWTRLITWAEEERASAAFYARLSQAAFWHDEGTAGLWRDPELALGSRWRRDNSPTAAWAARYNDSFDRAIAFLDESEQTAARLEAEREQERRSKLARARWAAGVLATLLLIAVATAYVAWRERRRAESNFTLARRAVDETLASASVDPAQMAADVPQMQEFRRQLLEKTKQFYVRFIEEKPNSPELYWDNAEAKLRLGHIGRMLGQPDEASKDYGDAIAAFDRLHTDEPDRPEYAAALADAWNWLGETLRPMSERSTDAERAYDKALDIQQTLTRRDPGNAAYQRQLARTHYNRGILRSQTAVPGADQFRAAEADFRTAIALLKPLAGGTDPGDARQELGRAYNNLGSLIEADANRLPEVRTLFERAVALDEQTARDQPGNRQNKLELATICNNLADLLDSLGAPDLAMERSSEALRLLDELSRPAPSLGVELADTHTLRGRLMALHGQPDAAGEYRRALTLFEQVASAPRPRQSAQFHLRFGDLLQNLAALTKDQAAAADARTLLTEAVDRYLALADRGLAAGARSDAAAVVENLGAMLDRLSESDRRPFTARYERLRRRLGQK